MRPVFLFDVGVVIFVVSTRTGELYGLFSLSEVPQEVVVEELGAIVGIKAQEGEREGFFDIFELLHRSF